MAEATERLRRAIRSRETVAVFGDYDADGITSTAIATLALRAASAGALPALVELPTRADGYGLNVDAVRRFAGDGASLLLALDCGSSDHDALALARSLGMDAIVVDHHELHGPPPAGATLVSARLDPASPYRGLSAAGLALLLATALARSGFDVGDGPGRDPVGLADLAMIGIVADVCDLRGPARTIVRDGLRRARTAPRAGLSALLRGMDLDPAKLDSRQVARRLGPALNAPGRRADPTPAFDLLLAGSALGANGYVADVLAALEWARAERTRHAGEQAARFRTVPGWEGRRVAVLDADDCPSGIAGSVASHLAAELARPVVVLGRTGSASAARRARTAASTSGPPCRRFPTCLSAPAVTGWRPVWNWRRRTWSACGRRSRRPPRRRGSSRGRWASSTSMPTAGRADRTVDGGPAGRTAAVRRRQPGTVAAGARRDRPRCLRVWPRPQPPQDPPPDLGRHIHRHRLGPGRAAARRDAGHVGRSRRPSRPQRLERPGVDPAGGRRFPTRRRPHEQPLTPSPGCRWNAGGCGSNP
jgi:single-stranded-DNA-specific exonuclease